MELVIFSVHDSKAEAFVQPFFTPTVATGLRAFESSANDPDTMMCQHPGDYTLFELGTFEHDTAAITLHNTPINHGLAIAYKTADRPQAVANLLTKENTA